MKRPIQTYVFTPASSHLDLSSTPNFDIRSLYAVIDLKTGTVLYAPTPALTFSAISNGVMTLGTSMAGLSASDPLLVLYDDGVQYAEDASVQAVTTALAAVEALLTARLPALENGRVPSSIDADTITLMLPSGLAQDASIQAIATRLGQTLTISGAVTGTFWQATQPVSVTSLPLPSGAATAALQPALNADGGAQAHVTNFPATQVVSGSVGVTGTFWQTTQPVSWSGQSVSLSGTLPAFAVPPTVNVGTMPAVAVTGVFYQTTQPVSAAALPLPAGAAQDGSDVTGATMPTGGIGIRGWLSASYGKLTSILAAVTAPLPAGTNTIGAVSIAGTAVVSDAQSLPFQGAVTMTPGLAYAAQRSVGVLASVAGNVSFTFSDSSTVTLPVYVGWQTFPFSCTSILTSGTTATATYFNLK